MGGGAPKAVSLGLGDTKRTGLQMCLFNLAGKPPPTLAAGDGTTRLLFIEYIY